MWLDFFEIADSFDTTYDEINNTIYGKIKPKMLSEEVRMDSLGVGFSQLAPIILLCLTSVLVTLYYLNNQNYTFTQVFNKNLETSY